MVNNLITSAVLLGTAGLANALGRATVINGCSFPVSLTNVPSAGGGANQVGPQSLNTGGSYSQEFTALTNGNGWSMKLSTGGSAGILQFEYTYQSKDQLWYDLSAVNGDPFNGNWDLSGTGSCNPKQTAYRFSTDDTYGMQDACSAEDSIAVTLCGGGGAAAPAPNAAPSSPAAPSDPVAAPAAPSAPPAAPPAPAAPSAPAPAPHHHHHHHDAAGGGASGVQQLEANPTVKNVKTVVVTKFVTVSPSPVNKREEHLHRHARRHNHF